MGDSRTKIVKFNDGTYAVRKGNWLFGYEYFDKDTVRYECTWSMLKHVNTYCKAPTLEEAKRIVTKLTDYGTPVK